MAELFVDVGYNVYIRALNMFGMRVNKSTNSNMRFLFGSVCFFAVLLLVIVLFTYYAMSEAASKMQSKMFVYSFSFTPSSQGRSCDIFLDDSLLYSTNNIEADTVLMVNRYFTLDSVFADGKMAVRETPHFTPGSLLRVVGAECGDTLDVELDDVSNILVGILDDSVDVRFID